MKLSMIVVMTSLTPRVTLSTPGMAPQAIPVTMATRRIRLTWSTGGRSTDAPTKAAIRAAMVNWPSTPMLNRPILKAMAKAMPDR